MTFFLTSNMHWCAPMTPAVLLARHSAPEGHTPQTLPQLTGQSFIYNLCLNKMRSTYLTFSYSCSSRCIFNKNTKALVEFSKEGPVLTVEPPSSSSPWISGENTARTITMPPHSTWNPWTTHCRRTEYVARNRTHHVHFAGRSSHQIRRQAITPDTCRMSAHLSEPCRISSRRRALRR